MQYLKRSLFGLISSLIAVSAIASDTTATPPPTPDENVTCEVLVIGGGLAGSATAYEALLAGRTVCMTEITDWVGGQISSQGTSALDERTTQRALLYFPRGYLELRKRIEEKYGRLNPGACWVSQSCFMPYDGHQILFNMLQDAAKKGKGNFKWFPSTVVKDIEISDNLIIGVTAIQHEPAPGTPPLNTEPLSQIIEDAYSYEDSPRLNKTIIRFDPPSPPLRRGEIDPPSPPLRRGEIDPPSPPLRRGEIDPPEDGENPPNPPEDRGAKWYVIEATETGEILGLTDVPYRLGVDERTPFEPTSSSVSGAPYCTQGFTYTFAMEATAEPQTHELPPFYQQYAPYYSYELERLANFNLVYTYRRIHSMNPDEQLPGNVREWPIYPGDISMQNWTWGNDYRPGNPEDNFIFTRNQLQAMGQLEPGEWMGGLRTETLERGEENAIGYFYWLVEGTTDSQLGEGVKKPHPNHRFVTGLDSPMGTVHGLSKYPYIREGRRVIGRPSWGFPEGFEITEIDISRNDFRKEFYQENLSSQDYRALWAGLAGLELPALLSGMQTVEETNPKSRATIYPDTVGIGHYAIDFHPCMTNTPPEAPGNTEREGERLGQGAAYPFQIPLRAMIPQEIDNLLVVGKSIATSHVAAAAYRVHSFEWSSGVAAGITADFALETGIKPYELVDDLPLQEPQLEVLKDRIQKTDNPIYFPETSIFNNSWEDWK
ncbi:FAD-dependent oxidoreductase [Capilliphycus salinus ALCB114379]|uniref:FAD-dependent oxidoreductase n=1 Tax=Capilliphycus salinus TaxID=2768948 RepID=UPI0039A58F36